jgi:hypothetical protein
MPDIRIKNKKEKMGVLIDVAVAADPNVTQKEAEKRELMCRDATNVALKCVVIPAVIQATGLKPYQENIQYNHYLERVTCYGKYCSLKLEA